MERFSLDWAVSYKFFCDDFFFPLSVSWQNTWLQPEESVSELKQKVKELRELEHLSAAPQKSSDPEDDIIIGFLIVYIENRGNRKEKRNKYECIEVL